MTIIEQRAAESMARNLPRILTELIRANNLKALSIRLGIDQSKGDVDTEGYNKTLEAIMEGI